MRLCLVVDVLIGVVLRGGLGKFDRVIAHLSFVIPCSVTFCFSLGDETYF